MVVQVQLYCILSSYSEPQVMSTHLVHQTSPTATSGSQSQSATPCELFEREGTKGTDTLSNHGEKQFP